MRKFLLGLCISLASATLAQNKYLSFNDGYVNPGTFKAPVKNITITDSAIEVDYKFDGVYLREVQSEEGKGYYRVYMEDALYTNRERTDVFFSLNRLPFYKDLIVLPESSYASSCKLEILKCDYIDYKCPIGELDEEIFTNPNSYGIAEVNPNRDFYAELQPKIVSKSTFRTIPFATINTYPVWINSTENVIRCFKNIKYRITFDKKDYLGNDVKTELNKLAYDMFKKSASNPEILDTYDKSSLDKEKSKGCDYLIITTDDYKPAAEKLAAWKKKLGFKCRILSNNWGKRGGGVGNPAYLRNQIITYCEKSLNCMPDYLLIIGSDNDVPAFGRPQCRYYSDGPLTRFNDQSTNDEMIKGRICINSLEEAFNVVDKIINYEKNPPIESNFYDNALTISFLYHDDRDNYEQKEQEFFSSSEGISRDLEKLGYTVYRHSGMDKGSRPQYFVSGDKMPKGMYFEDGGDNEFWNKNSSHITNLINAGVSLVTYRGHGNRTGYARDLYTQDDIDQLNNGNKTPVFFNFTCSTGTFVDQKNDSISFAEYLLNKKNGGAVGVFANSEKTIHGDATKVGTETIKFLFNNQEVPIAFAILEALLKAELDETRELGHYFGDPSMKLYTTAPLSFNPNINNVDGTLTVDTKVKGARVTVCSIKDNGVTYFKSIVLDNTTKAVFSDVVVPCQVTISKANYVPYITASEKTLYLEDMTLSDNNEYSAENIITKDLIVNGGEDVLIADKSISLKAGTSISYKAKLNAKINRNKNIYTGSGKIKTHDTPLCFASLADIFTHEDLNFYDGDYVGNGQATSISDNSSKTNVIVYPNPTSGYINVVANDINEVAVMDIAGNTLIEQSVNSNNVSLDLSSFAKGMYLVKVVTAEDSYIKKVVLK